MLATPIAELNARTVQPYFTGLLAKALDLSLIATADSWTGSAEGRRRR